MLILILAMALRASMSEVPEAPVPLNAWECANQIEVWCAVDGCDAKPLAETTPMSINALETGGLTVCAYTGCWESDAAPINHQGRLIWAALDAPFSSQPGGGFTANLTLLIDTRDGVGFVRAGGLATPVLCARALPGAEQE